MLNKNIRCIKSLIIRVTHEKNGGSMRNNRTSKSNVKNTQRRQKRKPSFLKCNNRYKKNAACEQVNKESNSNSGYCI